MRRVQDVVFARRDSGPLLMDLVVPEGAGPFPAIVWLHGGGWFTGDRTLAPDLGRYFAARGFVMATIEYRLSGEALFPAQLFDVRAAIRYLRRHATDFDIDPGAVGLWGSSAGGHLATLAGLLGHLDAVDGEPADSGDARVQAVSQGYGPVDLIEVVAAAPPDSRADSPEARLLGGIPAEHAELAARANPLSHVSGSAPPFQLLHGTADVLVPDSQSTALHTALAAAGAESTLYLLEGFQHGFLNPGGRVEPDGPKVMDDGRLEARPGATAHYRRALPGQDEATGTTGASFDLIGDFFAQHLQRQG
ncbi:alpha/beta hydrolase [Saccharopolyspora gloriosae]|uniref:alpha/beta hydrolase n=1 Tax=Saccharopolyspora gloriosae TaxID=455344 RepID=UPI001FB65A27|nr:alpha/beta hydrolase [Saccharopolyspora gloriosae]